MSKHEALLLGLVGPPGAGKDTVANLLVEDHGFAHIAFADALRAFVDDIDPGWAHARQVYGYEVAKRNVQGFRDRLIEVGNAARTHIGEEVWVRAAATRGRMCLKAGLDTVVSDVRYRNEANWIAAEGGVLVAVYRPGFEPETPEVAALMMRCDYGVDNNSTPDDLRGEVGDLARELGISA